ncbi:IS5 family transposase [Streptomyces clavifer]|uniref:IS5 family transposase n=1 Tax=Streptomyces clavifer TaxID=68188 RepID=UPI003085CBB8|nr:IS5 family transposase [Streptomyces clavifer]
MNPSPSATALAKPASSSAEAVRSTSPNTGSETSRTAALLQGRGPHDAVGGHPPCAHPRKPTRRDQVHRSHSSRPFRSDHLIVGLSVSLTDAQWARIEPLLPDRSPKRGGRWRDHRQVIDAIAFKFQTGSQWVHLPERYGNWRGVYNRLRMWAVDGTWERVFIALMAQADADEDLNWAVSVDSTIVRAHQHAAGARKKGPRPASRTTMPSAEPMSS